MRLNKAYDKLPYGCPWCRGSLSLYKGCCKHCGAPITGEWGRYHFVLGGKLVDTNFYLRWRENDDFIMGVQPIWMALSA